MTESRAAKKAVASTEGTHEGYEPPDIDQRVAARWGGRPDLDVDWWMGMARLAAGDPMAETFYLAYAASDPFLHQLGDGSDDSRLLSRRMKDWGYMAAVKFVGGKGTGQRARSLVESYKVDWGHAAARDGIALALWSHRAHEIPGIVARATQYKCGKQAFQRVRDAVENQTTDLRVEFRHWLRCAKGEIRDRDYEDRIAAATGRPFA